jgi:serine/threonine protein kinase
MLNEE